MRSEYDCERCGIRVINAIPQPDEMTLCLECRFIEGIEDPKARAEAETFLDRINGRGTSAAPE